MTNAFPLGESAVANVFAGSFFETILQKKNLVPACAGPGF